MYPMIQKTNKKYYREPEHFLHIIVYKCYSTKLSFHNGSYFMFVVIMILNVQNFQFNSDLLEVPFIPLICRCFDIHTVVMQRFRVVNSGIFYVPVTCKGSCTYQENTSDM